MSDEKLLKDLAVHPGIAPTGLLGNRSARARADNGGEAEPGVPADRS